MPTNSSPTGDIEYKRWMMNTLQKHGCVLQHDVDDVVDGIFHVIGKYTAE